MATVVRVRGSAHCRLGARILIIPDGRFAGSISGRLASELCERVWTLGDDDYPSIYSYNIVPADDVPPGQLPGGPGVVEVLVEGMQATQTVASMEFFKTCRSSGRDGAIATMISAKSGSRVLGDRLLVDDVGECTGSLACSEFAPALRTISLQTMAERGKRVVPCMGCEFLVESVGPPVRLVILGAGADAIPLVAMAKRLGWFVAVADTRADYVRLGRFPEADRIVLLPTHDSVGWLAIDSASAVVVMTHDSGSDARMLRSVLPLCPAYLALVGPRFAVRRIMGEVDTAAQPDSLRASAGQQLGLESPESRASAILAEIHAQMLGHSGGVPKHITVPERAYLAELAS